MGTLTDPLFVALWVGASGGAARSPSVLPGDVSGLVVGDSPGKSACSSESLSDPTLRNSLSAAVIWQISEEHFTFPSSLHNGSNSSCYHGHCSIFHFIFIYREKIRFVTAP